MHPLLSPIKILTNLVIFGYDFGDDATDITFKSVLGFVVYIGSNLIGLAGLIAVIFIIWGGIRMVMSKGNQEEATQAKNTLTWAIIGFVVALTAYIIVNTFLTQITDVDLSNVN